MDEQTVTLRRWLFEVAMTLLLIFGGFAAASFICALAPGQQWPYGLALCVCFIPTLFWLRHCGIEPATRISMIDIVVSLAITMLIIDFVPAAWKANHAVFPAVFGATHWLFEWIRKRLQRTATVTPNEA